MILFLVRANLSVAMAIVIISTYPDKNSISKIAKMAVKKNLAACVNYTKITSIYRWKGKIENSEEFLALFKTTEMSTELLKKEIANTHPYTVPEIVELKMDSINLPYLDWLVKSTRHRKSQKRNNSTQR